MDVVRIIRQNESSWSSLFIGELGRLLPHEQRFACAQEPRNIAWISSNATLGRIAGICWEGMGFFALGAAVLVRQFERDETEDIIISECELVVVLIAVSSWCIRNGAQRIMIICTDNMNVFSWLSKWRAKSYTDNAVRKALIDFLIEAGIEIAPRYVRIDHNAAADYLARCTDGDVIKWAVEQGVKQIGLPK